MACHPQLRYTFVDGFKHHSIAEHVFLLSTSEVPQGSGSIATDRIYQNMYLCGRIRIENYSLLPVSFLFFHQIHSQNTLMTYTVSRQISRLIRLLVEMVGSRTPDLEAQ